MPVVAEHVHGRSAPSAVAEVAEQAVEALRMSVSSANGSQRVIVRAIRTSCDRIRAGRYARRPLRRIGSYGVSSSVGGRPDRGHGRRGIRNRIGPRSPERRRNSWPGPVPKPVASASPSSERWSP